MQSTSLARALSAQEAGSLGAGPPLVASSRNLIQCCSSAGTCLHPAAAHYFRLEHMLRGLASLLSRHPDRKDKCH